MEIIIFLLFVFAVPTFFCGKQQRAQAKRNGKTGFFENLSIIVADKAKRISDDVNKSAQIIQERNRR